MHMLCYKILGIYIVGLMIYFFPLLVHLHNICLVSCVMSSLARLAHHMLIVIFVTIMGKFCMSSVTYALGWLWVVMTYIYRGTNVAIFNHDEENKNTRLYDDKSIICCFIDSISWDRWIPWVTHLMIHMCYESMWPVSIEQCHDVWSFPCRI